MIFGGTIIFGNIHISKQFNVSPYKYTLEAQDQTKNGFWDDPWIQDSGCYQWAKFGIWTSWVYIYMRYIYIHTNAHTYICIYIHTNAHTYICIYIHTNAHTYMYIYIYIHTNIYIPNLLIQFAQTRNWWPNRGFPSAPSDFSHHRCQSWWLPEDLVTDSSVILQSLFRVFQDQWFLSTETKRQWIPSRELTYPPKMAFWRWFSFSQGGIC